MLPQQDADFDAELMRRCQPLLEIRWFDDAVNNAFRLLQVPSAIEALRESHKRLIAALLASEPTGYSTGGSKTDSAVNDSEPNP